MSSEERKASVALLPAPKKTTAQAVAAVDRGRRGYPGIPQDQLAAMPSVRELLEMLTYMRPAGTQAEEDFIEKYIVPLGAKCDGYENYFLKVGDDPQIIWSSHTDTVHAKGGKQGVTMGDGMVWSDSGSCLGADDTAGIWLMIQMIKAGVPGLYVFHREEECGGHGSTYINKHYKEYLSPYKAAIAFDRKGYDSVITHQFGTRCCSDAFAKSLAAIMGGVFAPDDSGVFTDTANYTDNVGECTNLSVGYHMAHGPNECQDVSFLVQMRDVLVNADWSTLVFERKAGEPDPDYVPGRFSNYTGYGYGGTRSKWTTAAVTDRDEDLADEGALNDLEWYITKYPDQVAKYLLDHGVTTEEIEDHNWEKAYGREGGGWKN